MHKVKQIIVIVCTILLFSSCLPFYENAYSLEDARKEKRYAKYYTNDNLIFSKELNDGVIDFIVEKDTLHIVCIVKKSETSKETFKIKSIASYPVSAYIDEQYQFRESTKLAALKYSWCIVTKQYNESHEHIEAFEFEYNNRLYHLCIKV